MLCADLWNCSDCLSVSGLHRKVQCLTILWITLSGAHTVSNLGHVAAIRKSTSVYILKYLFFLKISIILLCKLILSKQILAKRPYLLLSQKEDPKPDHFYTVAKSIHTCAYDHSISTHQNKFSMTEIQFNQENKSFQLLTIFLIFEMGFFNN